MRKIFLLAVILVLPLAAAANDDDTVFTPDCNSVYGFLDNCDLPVPDGLEKCEAGDPDYDESSDLFYCLSNVLEQSGDCDMAAGCLEYADLPADDDDNDDNDDNNDDSCGCTAAPASPAGPLAGAMILVGLLGLAGQRLLRRRRTV
ncbi:MAG TPA: MYXO-CTERM sorting domain-containing protein [bacterium]|nr:MYXO-CTERM sorting domain-containing protein [bacterium]